MSEKERQKKDQQRKQSSTSKQAGDKPQSNAQQVERNPGQSRTGAPRNTTEQGQERK
ncbi:MAG TPA: hypothetical protein VNN73_19115 [Blastocatellia bacterium]|nr:hypothetical protein [Blastocatellia bacterium]